MSFLKPGHVFKTVAEAQVNKLLRSIDENNLDRIKMLCKYGGLDLANIGDSICGLTALMLASKKGQVDTVKYLLSDEVKADTRITDKEGKTALMYACNVGCSEIVSLLIEHKSDVLWKDNDGRDALHHCLYPMCTNSHFSSVSLLLSNGANSESIDNSGRVALIEACRNCNEHESVAIALIAHCVDPNIFSQNEERTTSLHQAAHAGSLDVVRLLLEMGADSNSIDRNEMTPLHLAVSSGNVQVVQILNAFNANFNCLDDVKRSPLHMAAICNQPNVGIALIQRGCLRKSKDAYGKNCIALAKLCKNKRFIKQISKVKFNSKQLWKLKIYDYCCCNFNRLLFQFRRFDKNRNKTIPASIFRNIIYDEGFNHLLTSEQLSLLIDLHEKGNTDFNYELFLSGVKFVPKRQRICEQTLAQRSAKRKRSNKINQVLLPIYKHQQNDKPIFVRKIHNAKIMTEQASNEHVYQNQSQWLAEEPLDIIKLTDAAYIGDLATIKKAFEDGYSMDSLDDFGKTVLIAACIESRRNLVDFLINEARVSVNKSDYMGWSPLHHACMANDVKIVEMLIKAGAHVNKESITKTTPLMCAASCSNVAIFNLLIKEGASASAENENGSTAIDIGLLVGSDEFGEILKKFNIDKSANKRPKQNTFSSKKNVEEPYNLNEKPILTKLPEDQQSTESLHPDKIDFAIKLVTGEIVEKDEEINWRSKAAEADLNKFVHSPLIINQEENEDVNKTNAQRPLISNAVKIASKKPQKKKSSKKKKK